MVIVPGNTYQSVSLSRQHLAPKQYSPLHKHSAQQHSELKVSEQPAERSFNYKLTTSMTVRFVVGMWGWKSVMLLSPVAMCMITNKA